MSSDPDLLAGPWKFQVPNGDPTASENIRRSINAQGHYKVKSADHKWLVERTSEPPPLFRELDWKINAIANQGAEQSLVDHLSTWPALGGADDAASAKLLDDLDAMPTPTDPTRLAEVSRLAGTALMLSSPTQLPAAALRVAKTLLRWYPVGQMVIWAKSIEHINAGRPAHMLAGAALLDIDHVAEGLRTGRGGFWFRGEDIVHVHGGALYLNLVNGIDMPGWAFETPSTIFIFEFGRNISVNPPLDFMSLRYLHSLSLLDYYPPGVPELVETIKPGLMEQDRVRQWFLSRLNRLLDWVLRWENFITRDGELRMIALQETNMTLARLLNTSALLIASEERNTRLMAFWDLVDLYGRFASNDLVRYFEPTFWAERVIPACRTLPEPLDGLFAAHAQRLHNEWVDQCVQGVTAPSRVKASRVLPAGATNPIAAEAFFARHIAARRNTLHGYGFSKSDDHKYLAIHDGSLPLRLPEWGRLMLITLLAVPERYFSLNTGESETDWVMSSSLPANAPDTNQRQLRRTAIAELVGRAGPERAFGRTFECRVVTL